MLQKNKYNIGWKLFLQKKQGPLMTTERAWASASGENGHSSPLLEIGTKNQNFLALFSK